MRLSSTYVAILVASLLILLLGFGFVEPWAPRTRKGAGPESDSASLGLPPPPEGSTCFIQFYLGSLAVARGADPYAPLETLGAEAEGLRFEFSPFSHPPTSLLPYLPIHRLPFQSAIRLHLLLAAALIALCMGIWGRLLSPHRWSPALVLTVLWVLFTPSLHLLSVGQNSFFALVAVTAGAWALSRQPRTWVDLLGGLGMALAIVKPHIALLPLAGLSGYAVTRRRLRLLALAGGVSAAWILIWSAVAPESWGQFLAFLQRTPTTTWYASTLDGRLRDTIQGLAGDRVVRMVTTTLWILGGAGAAIWGGVLGRLERAPIPEVVALLAGLSLALCPHVFPYDFVLLLPLLAVSLDAALRNGSWASGLVLASWAGLSIAYLTLKTLYEQESVFWWMPWAALVTTAGVLLWDLRSREPIHGLDPQLREAASE